MTLPRKPPLKWSWSKANAEKRTDRCRVCGRGDRRIELAHVTGRTYDQRDALITTVDGREIRLATVLPARVIPLCGPAVDTGSCHCRYDSHRLDIWDYLTEGERLQAITDSGSLGQALHRCAPLTWQDRVELVDGVQVEMQI